MIIAASLNWNLFVSYDFGLTWDLFKKQPNVGFYNLVLSGSGEKIIAAVMPGGSKNATLYTSFDYGCSWKMTESPEYFTVNYLTRLASSYDGNIVLATGLKYFFSYKIYSL